MELPTWEAIHAISRELRPQAGEPALKVTRRTAPAGTPA